ncbi:MAG: hypothetical protein HYY37_05595 [Candidatus Aenigmarchaeota archaeon]|nr:hypothetical protein [Candidatus Aenigmarchaeota archaeon]
MKAKKTPFLKDVADSLHAAFGVQKKTLKHHLVGLEAEFLLLDNKGRIAHVADEMLRKTGSHAKKECAKNMLEIAAIPSRVATGTMHDMLDRTEQLLDVMEKEGYSLYCCGTYPGSFTPSMRRGAAYGIKEKIFGRERFMIAGRCAGLHCHYTLPRGVFDSLSRHLKVSLNSKLSQSMVGGHNLLIALDPAFTALAQSSPYYQGQRYGKDARVMFYRGSRIFGVEGLYTGFQEFGGLPRYTHTLLDVMHLIEDRFNEWSLLVKKLEVNMRALALYGSVLETNWSPVKINPLGTFEMRGMDMNRFEIAASLAALMKYVLKDVHENYLHVVDSDLAIQEPFKRAGSRILIPPYSYVSNVLQLESVLYGMDSPLIQRYCSRFIALARKTLPKDHKKFASLLNGMVQKKRTVSDEILARAKRMGYHDQIPQHAAAELALRIAEGTREDVERTRRLIARLDE